MKRAAIGLALVLTAVVCVAPSPTQATTGFERVDQAGTYTNLTLPNYAGVARLRDVIGRTPGPTVIGLGMFDRLNGELVIIGGQPYRVGADGAARIVSLNRRTPFMQAIAFHVDHRLRLPPGTSCADLAAMIDALAGTTAGVVAVRLSGTFTDLVTRSIRRQSLPFQPLATVAAGQVEFALGSVTADLVGFRTGTDLAGVGAPGLDLHGLTRDRTAGGHVLRCATDRVRLSVDVTDGVHLLDR